jgi:hypothetical protein
MTTLAEMAVLRGFEDGTRQLSIFRCRPRSVELFARFLGTFPCVGRHLCRLSRKQAALPPL